MVDFRKSLLLLAVLLVASSMASAQITPAFACTASAGVPPIVRAEGLAEFVGDVVLNCTGGVPTAVDEEVPRVNFRIFTNTNVTSALLEDDWTESILAIDDPAPGEVSPLRGPQTDNNNDSPTQSPDALLGVGGSGINYAVPGAAENGEQDVYNVFQGELVADNQIEWRGVPIDPPGTTGVRIIRITNVRANANAFGVSGTFVPAQLTMFISATGTGSMPINNPTQVVATVLDGMKFSVKKAVDFLQCEDAGKAGDCGDADMVLVYEENFASAFKRVGEGTDVFGVTDPDTESNYVNEDIEDEFGGPAGLATQGTRLLARFDNVPSGVTLRVWDISDSECNEDNDIFAQLVPDADSNGAGDDPDLGASGAWEEVDGSATWEITDEGDISSLNNTAVFGVDVVYDANTTAGIPALGTATVNGSYAPLSTRSNARSRSTPHPRFFDDSEAMDLFTINSCASNLLWPYVTNQAGFDTGMVISNTSMDPFDTATQEGACTIYYYGFTTGGGAAPAPVVTPNVPAGEHAIWTLSSGGTVQTSGGTIAGAPGFQGYVIAHCEFQMAHGYAFISDLGASRLAQGYLALIMDEQFGLFPRTKSQSEVLGN